jgi:hypothetical protein
LISIGKIGPGGFSSGKRFDENLRLDRFELVEADVMSCDGDKS